MPDITARRLGGQADLDVFFELAEAQGSLFCTRRWVRLQPGELEVVGLFAEERLVGGAVLMRVRRYGILLVRNQYFARDSGYFLVNGASDRSRRSSFEKSAMSAFTKYLTQSHTRHMLAFGLGPDVVDTQPLIWARYDVTPSFTYRLDLESIDDEAMESFAFAGTRRRRDIKQATRDGIRTVMSPDPDRIESLIRDSLQRNGALKYGAHLSAILSTYVDSPAGFGVVAVFRERDAAATFIVSHGDTAFYLMGGTNRVHPSAGVLAMAMAIQEARNRGCRYFDFEGSMIPSIEEYFRMFGAQLTPYWRVSRAPLAADVLLRRTGRMAF